MNGEETGSGGVSFRTAAVIAGIGLLLMAVLAPIANFNALQNLIVAGDASATSAKIRGSLGLFRTGTCFFLIVAALDVIVAWALYVVFAYVNKHLSMLAAWFRVAYAAILAVAANHLLQVSALLNGAEFLKAIEATKIDVQVMQHLEAFQSGWDSGMILFGLHLLLLGYLVFTSGFFPRFLGILIVIAAIGYLVDSFGTLFVPGYALTVSMFTFIGEVLLIVWLFWKGIKGVKSPK
jgi:hypothetical protein